MKRPPPPIFKAHARGITLVEVVLSSLVLAFVASGAVRLLVSVVDRRESAVREIRGALLADQMLAEVMSRQFESLLVSPDEEFGPSESEAAGKKWGAFDDCDDFDGWVKTPPVTAEGAKMDGLEDWARRVRVRYVTTGDLDGVVTGPTDIKQIMVTVKYQGRVVAVRVGCRSRAGQQTVEHP